MRAFALPPRGGTPGAALPLPRPGWPGAPEPDKAAEAQKAGERFEAMIIQQLLKSARPRTSLAGPTPLAAGQDVVHEQTERLRAEAMARSTPLGIGQTLIKEAK